MHKANYSIQRARKKRIFSCCHLLQRRHWKTEAEIDQHRLPVLSRKPPKGGTKRKELFEEWESDMENPNAGEIIILSEGIQHYIDSKRSASPAVPLAGNEQPRVNLLRVVGNKPVSKIVDGDINMLSAVMRKRGDSDNTNRHYSTLLNGVLQHAGSSFSAAVPTPGRFRGSFYPPGEVHQLLAAASRSRIRNALYIASYMGMLSFEISGLKWEKDNFDNNNNN